MRKEISLLTLKNMAEDTIEAENQTLVTPEVELKIQIDEAKLGIQQAKKTLQELADYEKKFIDIRSRLDNDEDGLEVNLEWSQKKKAEIDEVKTASDKQLTAISEVLASIQSKAAEVEASYSEFKKTDATVNHAESGMASVFAKSGVVKAAIDDLKQQAETQLDQIKKYVSGAEDKVEEMDTAFTAFKSTKAKIDDEGSGLEAILQSSTETQQKISAVKEQADGLFVDIKKFRDESQNYTKEISDLRSESETSRDLIKSYEQQSEDYKGKIAKIYRLATDTGLANSFAERKGELQASETRWFRTMIVSFLLLGGAALAIFWTSIANGKVEADSAFWYKITFTSPLIFLVGLATERYAHERDLLERYAFKAATAFALESYTTLLKNTFKRDDHEHRILDFVLTSMSVIYKEPFEQKRESKWSLGLNGKAGEVKTEFVKSAEEIITTPAQDGVGGVAKRAMAAGVKKVKEEMVTTETKPVS